MTRLRSGYTPNPTRLGTCERCGEPTVTRYGQTTHTPIGRGDLWQGTLIELTDCHPDRIAHHHAYDTTRTSPFGYYGTCTCGYVTTAYRETAKESWQDVLAHVSSAP
jgi:hypothetical protein